MQATGQELPGLRVVVDKVVHHRDANFPPETPHAFVYFLTISNVSFSAPKFLVQKSSANTSKSKNPTLKVGSKVTLAQLLALGNYKVKSGSKVSATVSTPKICKVMGKAIKGLAVGTCRGTMTIKPKKGKATKKAFTFKVTKTGKRLPVTLHR